MPKNEKETSQKSTSKITSLFRAICSKCGYLGSDWYSNSYPAKVDMSNHLSSHNDHEVTVEEKVQ